MCVKTKDFSGNGCLLCHMRAGPHKAGVLTLVLTLVRTRLGNGGQATAMALLGALSLSGPRFGAPEERKPFVLHHLEPPRPVELVAHCATPVPLVKLRSQVQVRPTRTALPERPS